jgi:hypothetical protein
VVGIGVSAGRGGLRRGRDAVSFVGVHLAETDAQLRRTGPFWDVMEGRRKPPPATVLLGWELIAIDPDAGTIEVSFNAGEQFLNPAGQIQGGFLAAMLDDTMGPALVATLTGRRHGDGQDPPRLASSSR